MTLFGPFLAFFDPFWAFFGLFWPFLGLFWPFWGGPGGVPSPPPFWAFLGGVWGYAAWGGIMLPRVSRSFLSEPVAAGLSAATLGCEGGTRRSRQPDRARFGCLFRLLME